jgi:putative DNA primase/helicase
LCHGEGANGKSTFLSAIAYVLGSYACNLPFSAFELVARSTIPNDVATLPGRRFVTAIETDESARLNEARIKALTGCDLITARSLYNRFFTFKPVAKFWLAFNHRPVVADSSHGFWRRVHLIPFVRQFNPQAEPNLEGTLRAEAPGILAWAVQGCLDWQKLGLACRPGYKRPRKPIATGAIRCANSSPIAAFSMLTPTSPQLICGRHISIGACEMLKRIL